MYRTKNTHKLPTALCTIGGFFVSTSALRVLVGVDAADTERKMMLRGADPCVYDADTKREVTKMDGTGCKPAASEPSEPYDSYDPDPMDLYEWAYAEVHGSATASPSISNDIQYYDSNSASNPYEAFLVSNATVSRILSAQAYSAANRTAQRALTDVTDATNATDASYSNDAASNLLSEDGNVANGVRLKLYWKEGYYWQENLEETWWCMMCGYKGKCKTNEVMRLNNCENRNGRDAKFTVIRRKKGDQLQITGTNFCLEKQQKSRKVMLRPCDADNAYQLFIGFRSGGKSFDLRPLKASSRCLTNHHHPKQGEEVYAEKCTTAHGTKTGYWVTY